MHHQSMPNSLNNSFVDSTDVGGITLLRNLVCLTSVVVTEMPSAAN